MPPYDPFTDVALLWGVVRVLTCEPASPTWRNPGVVTLAVERRAARPAPGAGHGLLRGAARGGSGALLRRAQTPRPKTPRGSWRSWTSAASRCPTVGARVIVWLLPPAPPPVLPEGFLVGPPGGPDALPPGMTVTSTRSRGWLLDDPHAAPVLARRPAHAAALDRAQRVGRSHRAAAPRRLTPTGGEKPSRRSGRRRGRQLAGETRAWRPPPPAPSRCARCCGSRRCRGGDAPRARAPAW
jgi:hypothetical protein